jgi:hypothetical protein
MTIRELACQSSGIRSRPVEQLQLRNRHLVASRGLLLMHGLQRSPRPPSERHVRCFRRRLPQDADAIGSARHAITRLAVPKPLEVEIEARSAYAQALQSQVGQPRRQVRIGQKQAKWCQRVQAEECLDQEQNHASRPALRLAALWIDAGMQVPGVAMHGRLPAGASHERQEPEQQRSQQGTLPVRMQLEVAVYKLFDLDRCPNLPVAEPLPARDAKRLSWPSSGSLVCC